MDRPDGYAELRSALAAYAKRWGAPVFFVHGDTHRYRVDTLRVGPALGKTIDNFMRLRRGCARVREMKRDPIKNVQTFPRSLRTCVR